MQGAMKGGSRARSLHFVIEEPSLVAGFFAWAAGPCALQTHRHTGNRSAPDLPTKHTRAAYDASIDIRTVQDSCERADSICLIRWIPTLICTCMIPAPFMYAFVH